MCEVAGPPGRRERELNSCQRSADEWSMNHSPVVIDSAVDPVEAALGKLLAEHPDSIVEAVRGESAPVVVPMPPTVPIRPHQLLGAATVLDVVVPADRAVVARLWAQARSRGIAAGSVRLLKAPGDSATLYFLDVRHRHDVM